MQIPVTAYTDEAQFQAEHKGVFESPISGSVTETLPGDFLTQTIMGKPLPSLDKEGVLHCFINKSRHRGAESAPRKVTSLDLAALSRGRTAIKAN